MRHMVASAVVPHLLEPVGKRGTIVSRSLKSGDVGVGAGGAHRRPGRHPDQPHHRFPGPGHRGFGGAHLGQGRSAEEAEALIAAEESILREELGDLVFAVDGRDHGVGGERPAPGPGVDAGPGRVADRRLVGSRISDAPGSSEVFRGSIVSYATDVKRSVLGVTAEHWVSAESAMQMAEGAAGCWAPTSVWP